jgi:GntR family transcriptional repressor for pyruvate dehydrogenase complex
LNSITEEERGSEIDRDFHYEIINCSKNNLIISIYNAVSQLIDIYIQDARTKIFQEEGNKNTLANQHENIYLALKNHDPEKAVDAMTMHLNFTSIYMSE